MGFLNDYHHIVTLWWNPKAPGPALQSGKAGRSPGKIWQIRSNPVKMDINQNQLAGARCRNTLDNLPNYWLLNSMIIQRLCKCSTWWWICIYERGYITFFSQKKRFQTQIHLCAFKSRIHMISVYLRWEMSYAYGWWTNSWVTLGIVALDNSWDVDCNQPVQDWKRSNWKRLSMKQRYQHPKKKPKHQLQISYKSPTNLKKYSSSISFFISLVLQSPPFKAPLKDFSHSWRARGGGWPLTWDSHFPTVSGMDWKTLKYVASQVRQASLGGFPEDKPIWGQRLP